VSARSDERTTIEIVGDAVQVLVLLGDVRVSVELPLPSGAGELAPAQFRSTILNSARRALEVARQELE
jgi:hypothetical protein